MTDMMTRHEREDLQRLVKQRERVLKSAAAQRSAEMLADFENQMGQQISFDQDDIWKQAEEVARAAVNKAQAQVHARCRDLGIPDRFAPSLSLHWSKWGYDNMIDDRKKELRRMAQTQIEAQERKAKTQIEMSCLNAQEKLAVAGLTSQAATRFIEALPSIENLMPLLSFAAVAGESEAPVAERLVTSNALRQRRDRERAALRNVTEALQAPKH